MTELERMKLRRYRDLWASSGLMPKTSEEALAMAIEAEATCRDISPFDPAKTRFLREAYELEQVALLLEKEEAAKRPAGA